MFVARDQDDYCGLPLWRYPEVWSALLWAARKINRLGGLALLSKRRMILDQYFSAEYNATRPFRKNQNIALTIVVGVLALVFLGVKPGYSHWQADGRGEE